MTRVLVLATTTGYQTRAFGEAAGRLGVELVFATDRCHLIEDPWQDGAVAIRFYDEDASVAAIRAAAAQRPIDGIVVVGDRPTVIAARVAEALDLPWHPPHAAAIARNKQLTRERFRALGVPAPWFVAAPLDYRIPNGQSPIPNPQSLSFPCVVKPVSLSGSRGVMRADNPAQLSAALDRLRALMRAPEVRAERNDAHETVLVEGFIPGREYAVEALMHHGTLHALAIFDKPDPLDGPFFEETIYVTPSSARTDAQQAIVDAIARATSAIGLRHGPIHAECRVTPEGDVYVLEVAARPIGGLCARALHFAPVPGPESPRVPGLESPRVPGPESPRVPTHETLRIPSRESRIPLEELLLRHALGDDPARFAREAIAAGVMMIPIPRRGIFRRADGVDDARAVAHVDDVRITAKPDQLLLPLPEGASYLGFIFARAADPSDVDRALRAAHRRLSFQIDPEFPLLTTAQINYNQPHG